MLKHFLMEYLDIFKLIHFWPFLLALQPEQNDPDFASDINNSFSCMEMFAFVSNFSKFVPQGLAYSIDATSALVVSEP